MIPTTKTIVAYLFEKSGKAQLASRCAANFFKVLHWHYHEGILGVGWVTYGEWQPVFKILIAWLEDGMKHRGRRVLASV